MNIQWFGQSCFKIEGEKSTLVMDPFGAKYGLKLPRLAADVVTISHQHEDHNNVSAIKSTSDQPPFVISEPGEYEIKNIFIYGIPSFHDNESGKQKGENVIYRAEIDGISLAHLGDLGHLLTNGQIEKLEGVDILFIPVGGTYTINAKQATEVISQIEPRLVIPMHFQLPELKLGAKIDGVDKFCKEIGICPTERPNKFKVAKKDLPQEDLRVVILQP